MSLGTQAFIAGVISYSIPASHCVLKAQPSWHIQYAVQSSGSGSGPRSWLAGQLLPVGSLELQGCVVVVSVVKAVVVVSIEVVVVVVCVVVTVCVVGVVVAAVVVIVVAVVVVVVVVDVVIIVVVVVVVVVVVGPGREPQSTSSGWLQSLIISS